MGLFLWLIILLAIAWGVADFQLQSRIEGPPPPLPVPKIVPAAPAPAEAAPPVVGATAGDPPANNAEPVPDTERSVTAQDTRPAAPVPERAPD
ncbi:MAG: hypothetical protein NTW45_02950 [Rhodocyclales bacterium]|nr:hypothetical protein [Rhodocyclales bacterium]